jgi:hypothetical protein
MTYSFHNRFTIFDERLNIDAYMHELADADHERVILRAGLSETMIKATGDLVLEGSRYADEATAVAAARRWRRDLTVALARSHIGSDFGSDDRVTPLDACAWNRRRPVRDLDTSPICGPSGGAAGNRTRWSTWAFAV